MFDIGWTEMAIIALIALVVIGPKDLPGAMRTVGHWVRRIRMMARDFQSGLDDMMRESELSEARKSIEGVRNLNPEKIVEDTVDPTGEVKKEARSLQEDAAKMEDGEAKKPEADKADKASGKSRTPPEAKQESKTEKKPESAAPGDGKA